MKTLLSFILVLLALTSYSQNSLNNYKYVLVPQKFDFSKEDDQYGLSSTTKLLLDQKGFVAFVGNAGLPPSLAANRCSALMADVVQKKGFFTTTLTLILKDCQGNIIFQGKEGKSREKEYPIAYNEALRNAFSSLNDAPYKYDSTMVAQAQPTVTTPAVTPAVTPAAPTPAPAPETAPAGKITGTLYAQATPNGFQLIDTSPKKVLVLLKTSAQDYYIAQAGASSGMVFKKDGEWVFEYYKDDKLVSQKLDIKF